MHLIDHKETHTQCDQIICSRQTSEAYLKATVTLQSFWLAIIGFKVHRWDVQYFGYVVCSVCVHRRELVVSGQREQPSRPAGGELPRRDSSCLLLLRRGAHFWLPDVCHIAEFNLVFP